MVFDPGFHLVLPGIEDPLIGSSIIRARNREKKGRVVRVGGVRGRSLGPKSRPLCPFSDGFEGVSILRPVTDHCSLIKVWRSVSRRFDGCACMDGLTINVRFEVSRSLSGCVVGHPPSMLAVRVLLTLSSIPSGSGEDILVSGHRENRREKRRIKGE